MAWCWWMDPRYNQKLKDEYSEIFKGTNDIKYDYDLSYKKMTYREELHIIDIILFFVKITMCTLEFVGIWVLLDHFLPY